jgi:2-amino-4-hydroxy-6-hydroxymethyldihydropteridine diphosphokinase
MVAQAFIGMGSNLAHPRRQIARATRSLSRIPATRVVSVSGNYATAPVGAQTPQPDYVNAVAKVATRLSPRALLRQLLLIERRQLRTRDPGGRRNLPRTLDLDLLVYDGRRLRTPALTLPHPRMHERAFVLRPLTDIAPDLRVPGHGLARRWLRRAARQRVRHTRTHVVR